MQEKYAVIKTGGHQYMVTEGLQLKVEKLEGAVGDKVVLDEVLLLKKSAAEAPIIGSPRVVGAKVEASIESQGRDPKILVFKYKRRKNYRHTVGHRQKYSRVKITKIAAA